MAELNLVNSKDELVSIKALNQFLIYKDEFSLIEVLWRLSVDIDEKTRGLYALVLLSAVNRCYGKQMITSLSSGYVFGNSITLLTEEARLLQGSNAKQLLLLKEMLSFIETDKTMSDSLRDISTRLLDNYTDGNGVYDGAEYAVINQLA